VLTGDSRGSSYPDITPLMQKKVMPRIEPVGRVKRKKKKDEEAPTIQ
jgi:hypothetical protein